MVHLHISNHNESLPAEQVGGVKYSPQPPPPPPEGGTLDQGALAIAFAFAFSESQHDVPYKRAQRADILSKAHGSKPTGWHDLAGSGLATAGRLDYPIHDLLWELRTTFWFHPIDDTRLDDHFSIGVSFASEGEFDER
jgi:hypothetical protein